MIAANDGISSMTKEHIFLCVVLKIPFILVISKIDMCQDRKNILEDTIKGINKFLNYPGIRRIPLIVKTDEDILLSVKNIYNESIVPIFKISNVTAEGIDNLTNFFNILGKRTINNINKENIVEFHIDNIFSVYGFGTVIGGHLTQ
jgi:GTPase